MKAKQKARAARKVAWWVWVIPLVILTGIGAVFLANQNAVAPSADKLPAEINVKKAVEMQAAGAFVLDVRTQEEWNDYHAPDSVLIPLDQLSSRLGELPRDREIVVVCRSGNRSASARDILLNAGFSKVTSMAGGLKQWSAQGYPTLTGP